MSGRVRSCPNPDRRCPTNILRVFCTQFSHAARGRLSESAHVFVAPVYSINVCIAASTNRLARLRLALCPALCPAARLAARLAARVIRLRPARSLADLLAVLCLSTHLAARLAARRGIDGSTDAGRPPRAVALPLTAPLLHTLAHVGLDVVPHRLLL
eukprot:4487463-Prymnesium_polylepis.1